MMNGIHREEREKKNITKSELKKLSYGNWNKMPLQHMNYQR